MDNEEIHDNVGAGTVYIGGLQHIYMLCIFYFPYFLHIHQISKSFHAQCVISTTKSPCAIESLSRTSTRLILPDTGEDTTDSI